MNRCYLAPRITLVTSLQRAHSFETGTPKEHGFIARLLDVEKNPRYTPTATSTFCNIAAHDFATIWGAYIPRVWWTLAALQRKDTIANYGKNCVELNANALYDWFINHGGRFGWGRTDLKEAQEITNAGGLAVIVARNKNRRKSGHISVIMPGNVEAIPHQWNAGRVNKASFRSSWYTRTTFDAWGVWVLRKP